MEIYPETDPEAEVQKSICPYCLKTFYIYNKIKNHIGIHIMKKISNLYNPSQQLQQPGKVNLSHEHLSMNRLCPVHRPICPYCQRTF